VKSIKKIVLIVLIILGMSVTFISNKTYAVEGSLNDAQRQGIVELMIRIIEEGNKARGLRYSQHYDGRNSGYYFRKTKPGIRQLTAGTTNLKGTADQMLELTRVLNESQGLYDKDDWQYTAKTLAYKCQYWGDDITDTVAFDCSSLCSAAYAIGVGADDVLGGAWCSDNFKKDSKAFKVISLSEVKPGDILWKKGHVAVYLGKIVKGSNQEYIAEAYGFAGLNKDADILSEQLYNWLIDHPEYIAEHPEFNPLKRKPMLELPKEGVLDATAQVRIHTYSPGSWKHACVYVGEVKKGRGDMIDLTLLQTTNPGDGSGAGTGISSSLDYGSALDSRVGPFTLDWGYSVSWPENLILDDQTLATSRGYFYKGTPTYGQYIGRVDMYNWFIEGPQNVLDWLIGFVSYGFKAALIGWTAILEDVMSNILNFGMTPTPQEQVALKKIYTPNISAYTETELNEKSNLVPVAVLADTTETNNNSSNNSGSNQQTTQAPATQVKKESEIDASDTKKKITIEDILFNRVPILDINFFDFENAGGQKLVEGSLLHTVRSTLAGWYYIIRRAVIMCMLVALLYIAIRMAASVPEKKAQYKEKLIDWLVGFIIVFFIHYFMVAIISLNNSIVKMLDPVISTATTVDTPQIETSVNSGYKPTTDEQTSLYEAIRIQCYDIKATTGITATVMYMVLVFYTIRFVIFYAKRMFTLAVLTVISPIMGVLYSINKKKYKIGDWGKEYIFNVLMQFMHAVIYTAIVGVALDVSQSSTFRGGVIALMTLGFLLVAEGMVKKIFGFNKAKSTGSLMNSTIGQMAAFGVMKSLYDKKDDKNSKLVRGTSAAYKWVKTKYNNYVQRNMDTSELQARHQPSLTTADDPVNARNIRAERLLDSTVIKPNTTTLNGREYVVDKFGVPVAPYDEFQMYQEKYRRYFNTSNINNRIKDTRKEEIAARIAYAAQGFKDIFNSATGSFSLMAAIPMLVISPGYGLGLSAYGIHKITASMGRRKIKGVKAPKKPRKWTGKRLVFAWATAGISEGVAMAHDNAQDIDYFLETTYPRRLALLKEARELEDGIAREIAALELERTSSAGGLFSTGKESERVLEAKNQLEQVALNIDKQEFEKAVNLTLEEVSKKDVEKIVEDYILKKHSSGLTQDDIQNIATALEERVDKKYKNIKIEENFAEVIREELRERIIEAGDYVVMGYEMRERIDKNYSENPTIYQGATYTNHAAKNLGNNVATADDIREKYSRHTDENNGTNNVHGRHGVHGQHGINHDLTQTDDERQIPGHKNNSKTNTDNDKVVQEKTQLHLRDRLPGQDVNPIENRITKKELEQKVDNVLKNMGEEELIDVIESALKRKEAINREIRNPRYAGLMRKIEELKKLDDDYRALTNEPIYQLYQVKNKKIEPKRNNSGEIEYQSVSEMVTQMRSYIVDYINGKA